MLPIPALLAVASALPAPASDSGYKLPPPEVVKLLDAPPTPSVSVSPRGEWMLLTERSAMPSIADVTRPWTPLAGIRIDPALNARQQLDFATGLTVRTIADANAPAVRIELPVGAKIMDTRWSHFGGRIAVTLATERGVELWMADARTGVAKKLAGGLNAVFGSGFDWLPDGQRLLVTLVPEGRGKAPADDGVPDGPAIQETAGKKTALRTYQDLLANPHDEALFEHHALTQLALVDPRQEKVFPIGKPGLYTSAESSPDGRWLLVTRLVKPFSYVLPASLFPHTIEVWSQGGELAKTVATVPMGESIPMEGVRTGPRNVHWHAAADAQLVWTEALDGGDPKTKAEWRDRWMALAAPFSGEAHQLARLHHRARGITYFARPDHFVASEYDRDRRWQRELLFDALDTGKEPVVLDDRSTNDRYGDPGNFAMTRSQRGTGVIRQDGNAVYRSGRGASATGDRPFLDRFDLATRKSERLWQCAEGTYETLVAVQSSSATAKPAIVTSLESPKVPPNYLLRELERGTQAQLTSFPDPQPALRGIRQELVKYERKDGVDLSATLYLPANHQAGTRLPLFVWAYPLEFSDAGTAGQVSGSPHRFVRVRGASHLLFAQHGWAVLDNATMPVVGDPETMNDTFLEQVVASAEAAIAFAVDRGIAERGRVAVGGHSYGAFMTANLLAHCDLFAAGVARSGAYNRTLTPFGFQSERRTIWEAPEPYLKLSPFLVAHKINEPLLLIHGEKDSNMGTFPIQSERLYQAVKGNGGTARLVFLPGESHGYSARESVLHTVAEMFEWCDRFVRDARPAAAGGAVEAASPGR